MRKETYNIVLAPIAANPGDKLIRRGDMDCVLKSIEGYTFRHGGLAFGVTNKSPNATIQHYWTVTELKSGYVCAHGATRRAAIVATLSEPLIKQLRDHLQHINNSANPGLIPWVLI